MPIRETAWPAGTPCWVDYAAEDVDAARALYAELFGWEFTGGSPEFGGYSTAHLRGHVAAGMAPKMDPSGPTTWTTWFASEDVDATAARITEAGGTVLVPPMDVGPMGRMALALDPEGVGFGVWQAGSNTGVDVYNEPGSLVWTEAAVDDTAGARRFYSAVFDWTWEDLPGEEAYATFAVAGRSDWPVGGLGGRSEGVAHGWSACFSVASTDDTVALLERHGGKVTMPAQDTEFGRFAVVQDPWGASFSVMQAPPAPSS